jgi:hypothetical protein
MPSLFFDVILALGLGVWMVLLGFKVVTINRDPEKSAAWYQRWGLLMKIGGPLVFLWGVYNLVRFFTSSAP